jgi:hypothetical protein
VYGTESQPYLSVLSGSSPSNYKLPGTYQKPWTTPKTIISSVNDLWVGCSNGVDTLTGVQEYGDVRSFSESDPIDDRIVDYWDSDTALAGYYPDDGQYWLVMPNYHRVLVAHTKLKVSDPTEQFSRYPWAEYEFYKDVLTSASYRWTLSSSGTNEYYCEAVGGGDPSILTQPDFITMDGKVLTEGTLGSLGDHQWDYGDNDGLGFNTPYVRDESGDPDTTGVDIRSIFVPTAMAPCGETFLLGGSDGWTYKVDKSKYKDMGVHQIRPKLSSAYMILPYTHGNFSQFHVLASAYAGAIMTVYFYTNGAYRSVTASKDVILGGGDELIVSEAIMDVDDALLLVDVQPVELFKKVNFNARSVLFTIDDVTIIGYPIYFDGLLLKYRRLSH